MHVDNDLDSLSLNCKNLKELVLFPVPFIDRLVKNLNMIELKKLETLHVAIVMADDH